MPPTITTMDSGEIGYKFTCKTYVVVSSNLCVRTYSHTHLLVIHQSTSRAVASMNLRLILSGMPPCVAIQLLSHLPVSTTWDSFDISWQHGQRATHGLILSSRTKSLAKSSPFSALLSRSTPIKPYPVTYPICTSDRALSLHPTFNHSSIDFI